MSDRQSAFKLSLLLWSAVTLLTSPCSVLITPPFAFYQEAALAFGVLGLGLGVDGVAVAVIVPWMVMLAEGRESLEGVAVVLAHPARVNTHTVAMRVMILFTSAVSRICEGYVTMVRVMRVDYRSGASQQSSAARSREARSAERPTFLSELPRSVVSAHHARAGPTTRDRPAAPNAQAERSA
ncbi:hypothetical protein ABH940_006692 [Streptacidiphilus sp. BW17]|uniref:hypothetical protein n=1 Tax=Streptacidiphilus sp. BW17 TaxID=3156274 RepID=UPI003515A5AC